MCIEEATQSWCALRKPHKDKVVLRKPHKAEVVLRKPHKAEVVLRKPHKARAFLTVTQSLIGRDCASHAVSYLSTKIRRVQLPSLKLMIYLWAGVGLLRSGEIGEGRRFFLCCKWKK